VRKLRAAGAIILGKTNLSEWANFRSYNSTNGWSPLGGQVYGPYFPNQDPWGSSSGSGVAAAWVNILSHLFFKIALTHGIDLGWLWDA